MKYFYKYKWVKVIRTDDNETMNKVSNGSFLDKKIIRKIDLSVKSLINTKDREYQNEDRNVVFIYLFFMIY